MITRLQASLAVLAVVVVAGLCSTPARSKTPFDYDIAVFSPNGELKQVQYATVAARRGNPVLCARNDKRCLVWIPRDPIESLYDTTHGPSFRKLQRIDAHAFAAFSGIAADGRVLMQHLRESCQQYRRNFGSAKPVRAIAHDLAHLQFMHTTSMASRPFGVQCIVVGADVTAQQSLGRSATGHSQVAHSDLMKRARLFTTDPAGSVEEATCAAIGSESDAIMKSAADEFKGAELSAQMGVDIIKPLLKKLKQDTSSTEQQQQHQPETEVDTFEMIWNADTRQLDFVQLDDLAEEPNR